MNGKLKGHHVTSAPSHQFKTSTSSTGDLVTWCLGDRSCGFTYIWLMIFVAVMCVNLAIVAPVWKTVVKRDKEEELHARLESIRNGIKEYKKKYNKLPSNISELVTYKCLRRPFSDPMTGKLDWTLNGELGFSDVHSSSKEESMKSAGEKKDYYSAW